MPEIEENCITDLATCRNTDVKGEVRLERRKEEKKDECLVFRLGNELFTKKIQTIGKQLSRSSEKIHATISERSIIRFSLDESV